MALILQIETSTASCSVALSRDGNTIALKEINEQNAHASFLTIFIGELMQQTGLSLKELDAVAVSMGPGSYTGLRIGVSTAKGLCYALDIPLIAVNTLMAMASKKRDLNPKGDFLLCPMIDARRMEVYTAVFDGELREVMPVEAKIIDENSFSGILMNRQMLFFGDGAGKCREVLGMHSNALFEDDFINSASGMSAIAYSGFLANRFEDVAYFEPYYLKDFIAGGKKTH